MPPRHRSRAPAGWCEETYVAILHAWVEATPSSSLVALAGPWVANCDKITPSAITRLVPLVELLLAEKVPFEGVVHSTKFEAAIVTLLTQRPKLLTSENPFMLAHEFTDHVAAVLKSLRTMRLEDDAAKTALR